MARRPRSLKRPKSRRGGTPEAGRQAWWASWTGPGSAAQPRTARSAWIDPTARQGGNIRKRDSPTPSTAIDRPDRPARPDQLQFRDSSPPAAHPWHHAPAPAAGSGPEPGHQRRFHRHPRRHAPPHTSSDRSLAPGLRPPRIYLQIHFSAALQAHRPHPGCPFLSLSGPIWSAKPPGSPEKQPKPWQTMLVRNMLVLC